MNFLKGLTQNIPSGNDFTSDETTAESLNSLFLRRQDMPELDSSWQEVVEFYRAGWSLISDELAQHPHIRDQIQALGENASSMEIGAIFFPEGVGLDETDRSVNNLRKKRKLTNLQANSQPIQHVGREVLFTSNALLTVPMDSHPCELEGIEQVRSERQRFWYDHPIPMGIPRENNEIIYGLEQLDAALEHEQLTGKVQVALSLSMTHKGLRAIGKNYLRQEIHNFNNLEVYAFSEEDTEKLRRQVLQPLAEMYQQPDDFSVFGVDGEYGRHYSFLKAITPLWQLAWNPETRATFKIDLDQVFPQNDLKQQSGKTAFEHLKSPLWGGKAVDSWGREVELGMIAGALVNQKDIHKSLFTPDVTWPQNPPVFDEVLFNSRRPQAVSTVAEMMADEALERIHVTGGTNGIMIDSLYRHRPFTPSLIGRAEDQAYIMSSLCHTPRLAYIHEHGLIMRHDKEQFAQEAIQAAATGKLVGDYIRVLQFSAYAKIFGDNQRFLKELLSPFTGCFISDIPVTLTYLRFALRAARFFAEGEAKKGLDFICNGAPRLSNTLRDIHSFKKEFEHERQQWNSYYDILENWRHDLQHHVPEALELQKTAKAIIADCRVSQ